jgi:hypothetical protein
VNRFKNVTILLVLLATSPLFAEEDIHPKETIVPTKEIHKRELLANYTLIYKELPGTVDNLTDMLRYGLFYWRLRSNSFYWDWRDTAKSQGDHFITGLGGSLVYKSSTMNAIDFTLAGYFSQAFFDDTKHLVDALKPGKDLLSRFNYANDGDKYMAVLGQAFVRYSGFKNSKIRIGRQLVETFYTKSNDSKMIPNTFDGIVLDSHLVPHTKVRLAYLVREKLRDHTSSHALFAYGDTNATDARMPQWRENDDAVMHRGLTWSNLEAAGIDPYRPLIVGDMHNTEFEDIHLDGSFYVVPELLSQVMGEVNWHFQPFEQLSVTPGLRYIYQFDNGAGAIGGASYYGKTLANLDAYENPDSLDAQMIAARLIFEYQEWIVNLATSYVLDEADLVTPWRGFPTAGYTRSMGQYNWKANTKSYRIDIRHNLKQQGNYKHLFVEFAYLYTNEDESKSTLNSDRRNVYLGLIQNLPFFEDLQWRFRIGYTDADKDTYDAIDARFELNYLF